MADCTAGLGAFLLIMTTLIFLGGGLIVGLLVWLFL